MKFSVCLATGYEGLAYPIPFCEPQDLVKHAVLCEEQATMRFSAMTISPPNVTSATFFLILRTSTTC